MATESFEIDPIGVIRTPYTSPRDMPIQPVGAPEVEGTVEVFAPYAEGLADLDGFSHVYLLYRFHRAAETRLTVTPFMDDTPRGVYATRAPLRPNHLGLSVVELIAVDGATLTIRGVDVLDRTPLIDIKPYIEAFDHRPGARSGWMTASAEQVRRKRSDERFA